MPLRFRIQYASNLYVTRHEKPLFPHFLIPTARHLAIVGNVGNPMDHRYDTFFEWAARRWDTIVYVPGTLETPHLSEVVSVLSYYSHIHVLTPNRPFFIYEESPTVLWTSFSDIKDSSAYRKLFLFNHGCSERKVFLKYNGVIYSHGLNGVVTDKRHDGFIYTNSRGDSEHPEDNFSTAAILQENPKA